MQIQPLDLLATAWGALINDKKLYLKKTKKHASKKM